MTAAISGAGIGDVADFGFPLDPFQIEAIEALRRGESVLVAAPTGSGKTVVAEYAVAEALKVGQRAFYTAPIKALSNQKYRDFSLRYGDENVGLLTGDNSINGDAPIVVMTTEVLRNMIYARSPALERLRYVVLDEVHYLQDAYRGPVWEEVIIHLDRSARLVCLSATASNAGELGEWIGTARGPTHVVVETRRPVELENLFMAAERHKDHLHLFPTLLNGRPNSFGQRFDLRVKASKRERGRPRHPYATPLRTEVISQLAERDLLPAIYFIFSRKACDDAVRMCLAEHLRFTDTAERERIRSIVEERTAGLTDSDLDILRYDEWVEGLERGIASHHAGLVPPFKETVEVLFTMGLVKVVFATETLALGVNMPARTVVIEKLTKFTGEHHQFLTAAEYTQLTGRAGRRGIDTLGHAVVLWSPWVTFQQVADLAASRSFVLRSSFRPTYNMAANLVRRYEQHEARTLLNRSFAQFQLDHEIVALEARLARRRNDIERLTTGDLARPPKGKKREDEAKRKRRVAEWLRLAERDVADIENRIAKQSDSLAGRFDDVLSVLTRWGFVDGWSLTGKGERLVRIFHEADLLIAEALDAGLFDGLDVASFAGLASVFVYEHRSPNPPPPPWFPSQSVRDRYERISKLAWQLNRDEESLRLPPTKAVDPTFFALAHAWAAGNSLETVLDDEDVSGGDFVRTVKMLADVLGQLAQAAPEPDTRATARRAADAVLRGVVALSGSLDAD